MKKGKIEKNIDKQKKKKKKHIGRRILFLILIILIAIGGFLGYKTIKNGGGAKGFVAAMLGEDTSKLEELDPVNVLLIGKSQEMTDTIIVCSYDPKTQNAAMLSIPRDTFIGKNKNKATGSDKINSVYKGKHSEKLMNEVSELIGIDLNYYVIVDTDGLIDLVDSIGGVWFDVPIDMKYDDKAQDLHINLKAGEQLIDGEHAEQLLRFRHNNNGTTYPEEYGDNDYGRMRTQREFIKAAISQTLKVSNVLKAGELLEIVTNNVKTNMEFNFMKKYIPYAIEFNINNLQSEALPGESEKCNGVWLFIHDEDETEETVNRLFNYNKAEEGQEVEASSVKEETTTSDSAEIKVEILNGSNVKSNLTELTEKLKKQGYNVIKTGTTTSTQKTSIINNTGKSIDISNKIKNAVGEGSISFSKTSSSKADFTIIIGKDY